MTYIPITNDDIGYFTSMGLIGGTTGMIPLLSFRDEMTAPDAWETTQGLPVVTDTIMVAPNASTSGYNSYTLPAAGGYDKVLMVAYGFGRKFGVAIGETAFTGVQTGNFFVDSFIWRSADCALYSTAGGVFVLIATDATMTMNSEVNATPILGVAVYADNSSGAQVQRTFLRTTGGWCPVLTEASANLGTDVFKAVAVFSDSASTNVMHCVTPLLAWGKES